MTALMFDMVRDVDVTGISGTGRVGTVVEFDNGDTVLHWDTATPSTCVYRDSRHIHDLHGHGGATRLVPHETRLERAYKRVTPWLLSARRGRPVTCAPHPDRPDRLRLTFKNERDWRWWIALLDGSSHAATHVEVAGEIRHRWIDPSGDTWLEYYTPISGEDPLERFDREDR